MEESGKPKAGYTWRYERAEFGGMPVLVTSEFAGELRALQAELAEEEGDEQAEAAGQVWPGLDSLAGEMPLPSVSIGHAVPAAVESGRCPEGLAGILRDAAASAPIRLCTPVLLPEVSEVLAAGVPELSVSVPGVGSLLSASGPLAELARRAATARGADHALVSVAGCTSANRAVMAMIASRFPGRPVAVPLNAHHSVLNAAQVCGVPVVFLRQHVLGAFDAVLPPSAAAAGDVLRAHTDIAAVFVTSPSYEGVLAPVSEIADVVHSLSDDCVLVVDQAWGAHLGVSAAMPASAISLGADVVCESTHKQGGAPNQAAVLLWRNGRVDGGAMRSAYRAEVTTSPSYPLLAGLDTALRALHSPRGRARLRGVAELGDTMRAGLASLGFVVLDADRAGRQVDPMKVTVSAAARGYSGYEVAGHLARAGIAVERAGLRSVVMIIPYDVPADVLDRVLDGFATLPAPAGGVAELPVWAGHSVQELVSLQPQRNNEQRVAIRDSVGMVCAEMVECYPPGVAVLVPGMVITAEAVYYLEAVRLAGGEVVSSDPDFSTVSVLDAHVPSMNELYPAG